MRAINLLPRDEKRRAGPALPTAVAVTALVSLTVVTVLLCGLFLSAHGNVSARQLELTQKDAELAAIPVPAQSQLQQQDALVADKQARVAALNTALSRRIAWDRILREFALVLPDDVWLLSMSATAPTLGGQLGFNIEGHTYSHDAVARLLSRLSVIPDLERVQLVTSEETVLGSRTAIHFKIAANVRAPGASS
jgi:Tfp pilus assembly protein PilN